MSGGDEYRAKAAELSVRAGAEENPVVRAELESLSLAYLRLADQADRNATIDLVYETPPRAEPRNQTQQQQTQTQQQQQPQPPRRDDDETDG